MDSLIESLESRTLLTVTLDPVAAQAFPGGKSIFVPVTGTTDSASRVSYSVASSNPAVFARALPNLSFMRMYINIGGTDRGYMEFALFDELAPMTVGRITQLVNEGFYNGLTFHRVIPGFMAQGGDPSGTGAGGTGAKFDDEFHPDALFTTTGQLAMANAGPDTNESQFFITVDDTRWLDFRHTIFGQLVRGREVLEQIMAVGTSGGDSEGRTTQPVIITSAVMVQNNVDTVILVKGSGETNITVTAQDHNSTSSQGFFAGSYVDTQDTPPFLHPIEDQQTVSDLPLVINTQVTDIDGGDPYISAIALPADADKISVTVTGSQVVVTPLNGFSGVAQVLIGVLRPNSGTWDTEQINVTVLPGPFAKYDGVTRTLKIDATSGNDNVFVQQVGNVLNVTVNGKTYQFGAPDISTISAVLGDGDDVIQVKDTFIPCVIYGGLGNDYIFGGDGDDTLFGGEGDDTLHGASGNDYIDCGPGHDLAGGQKGWDTIIGAAGRDTLRGGDNADVIRGGGAKDMLYGGKGMDTIYGAGGNDTIDGQEGADVIYGGEHEDVIYAGGKLDRVFGDAGDDIIYAFDGLPDTISGGDGFDTVYADILDIIDADVENILYSEG